MPHALDTNMKFSVVYRSCNRVLIGKIYWNSVVQPRILNASSVIVWSGEKRKLQSVEADTGSANVHTCGDAVWGNWGIHS